MSEEENGWAYFYQQMKGRPPRQLLLDVLEKYPGRLSLRAVDLGCGDGTESALLLERGWNVLAIDSQPAAIQLLLEKIPEEARVRLQTQVTRFEDARLPSADLVHANYSLPFCSPDHFPRFWSTITQAIKPGGRFAGQFFGPRDSWANEPGMTFHTEDQVRALFEEFEIEFFQEMDEDGEAVGGPKHWHVFTVIAKKKPG
jgi:tellurite methyltransferase